MNPENPKEIIAYPKIAAELQRMVGVDQEMRMKSNTDNSWDESVDRENTERMKEIVFEIGWPTISKVGRVGSSNAWLLVQHADHNISFQEQCLKLMKEVPLYDIDPSDLAYLEDRVRVNKGIGQLYGTQFTQENNQHVPRPIEDEAEVDARRAAMGMGSLAEQIEHMYEKYPFDDKNNEQNE